MACVASTIVIAPASWASEIMSWMGLTVPVAFETHVAESSLVRSLIRFLTSSSESIPSESMGITLSSMPILSWSSCHGTMFAWCSISVMRISSPLARVLVAQVFATRLTASVALRVKITSLEPSACMKSAIRLLAPFECLGGLDAQLVRPLDAHWRFPSNSDCRWHR